MQGLQHKVQAIYLITVCSLFEKVYTNNTTVPHSKTNSKCVRSEVQINYKYNNSVNECKTQVTKNNIYIRTEFKYLIDQCLINLTFNLLTLKSLYCIHNTFTLQITGKVYKTGCWGRSKYFIDLRTLTQYCINTQYSVPSASNKYLFNRCYNYNHFHLIPWTLSFN